MLFGGLRRALDEHGFRSVQRPAEAALAAWQQEPVAPQPPTLFAHSQSPPAPMFAAADAGTTALLHDRIVDFAPPPGALPMCRADPATIPVPGAEAHPLVLARRQLATTYIFAQPHDLLVIFYQPPSPPPLFLYPHIPLPSSSSPL